MNRYLRTTCVLALGVLSICATAKASARSDDRKTTDLALSIHVSEPVVLGKPFRLQAFAVNHGDAPREVRIDPGAIALELREEEGSKIRRGLFAGGWKPDEWRESVAVPPGEKVCCFDRMIPTGLRWGSGCILTRGQARVSWQAWVRKDADPDDYEKMTVKSEPFPIHLKDPADKGNEFALNGLQVQLQATRRYVTSRDEASFVVKLKNVGDKTIRFSGRNGFDDNHCCFLIYAPGDQLPISEVVYWPTKGTPGFAILPGRTVERKFTAAWGVQHILVPGGPKGHVEHHRRETTFMKKGTHTIVVYFVGKDHSKEKSAWTGYVRSNVVTVDVIVL